MPPAGYERAYIMYTLNTDTVPSFYNGTRSESGNTQISIEVANIKESKIKVQAVVCRPGFADSEVVVKLYTKGVGARPERGDYVERGRDEDQATLSKSEMRNIWGSDVQKQNPSQIMQSDQSMLPPPSSENSNILAPPSSRSSGDDAADNLPPPTSDSN